MSFRLKTNLRPDAIQAPGQPAFTALELAVLGLPNLQFWFCADSRAGEQARLSYRDRNTGALLSGYGAGRLGSAINGKVTHKGDGTPGSRVALPWTLPPSYSAIFLWRQIAAGGYQNNPLICDAAFTAVASPNVAMGPNQSAAFNFRHTSSGGSGISDNTISYANATNYITYCSFDGGTLAADIATNHRTSQKNGTFLQGVNGAATLYLLGTTATPSNLQAEISDVIVLNIPIANRTAYATQADVVLNYLADKSGITLGA
jgi:hypothetical protein